VEKLTALFGTEAMVPYQPPAREHTAPLPHHLSPRFDTRRSRSRSPPSHPHAFRRRSPPRGPRWDGRNQPRSRRVWINPEIAHRYASNPRERGPDQHGPIEPASRPHNLQEPHRPQETPLPSFQGGLPGPREAQQSRYQSDLTQNFAHPKANRPVATLETEDTKAGDIKAKEITSEENEELPNEGTSKQKKKKGKKNPWTSTTKAEAGSEWWREPGTKFNEFARGYQNLVSVRAEMGKNESNKDGKMSTFEWNL